MTDIVRYRQYSDADFGGERARHASRHGKANSVMNRGHGSGNPKQTESGGHVMDVIVQPPARARVGAPLQPAVTVRLRSFINEGAEVNDITEPSQLLVMVSLTTDAEPNSSEHLQSLLFGRRVDSIRPFSGDDSAQNRSFGLGYASFSDLLISREGTYRLRLTLIKMYAGPRQAAGLASGGSVVETVDSNTIKVRASP